MALQTFNFTTGPSSLEDAGTLAYNGCEFSPLFVTSVSGNVVKDNAGRTTKLMDYTLVADGYVTLPDGAETTNGVMETLSTLLTACGGSLTYTGRGMDLSINPPGGRAGVRDVAWGPIPELLDFQPLGGGRSAKVQWKVRVRIPRVPTNDLMRVAGVAALPILQFNYETAVIYGEDGYTNLSIRGTLEVAMTRSPNQATRTLTNTVDDVRSAVETRVMAGIDLSRFRIIRRDFPVSRDKRTLEWNVEAEEKPYMDLPENIMVARGTYSVRPAKAGMGLCLWLCTLRCTYTVRADMPRRLAWFAFLAMLRQRMKEAGREDVKKANESVEEQNPKKGPIKRFVRNLVNGFTFGLWTTIFDGQKREVEDTRRALLIDFSFDEGMYLDSKTVSFSATWRLVTVFSHILLASGLWVKLPEKNARGDNLWATSVRDVSGAQSWLTNRLDPRLDVIVDFGGG